MAKMNAALASILLLAFLCSYAEAFSWASCACGPCAPGCKPEKIQLGGPNSRYCLCQCNCNPYYNPPDTPPSVPSIPPPSTVPTNPPPKAFPRPTPIPTPPKSSPQPPVNPPPNSPQPPSFQYPRKPQPPPSDDFGGFDVFGCVNIMESLDCCGVFNHFVRSCADGDSDMLPSEVMQYCEHH
ncbi:hypothetical protein RCOM_1333980 [Ricinus communis]|uniref:Structural constituent of cell wall n=1 Tax=Ricinus communis TaxID=3988 RepID=B9S756_RICCO|nr:hypothetical protein RCOM_1333980 [Ricinus communis]